MSARSDGDISGGRRKPNVVNPLLTTCVTGLAVEDSLQRTFLVPVTSRADQVTQSSLADKTNGNAPVLKPISKSTLQPVPPITMPATNILLSPRNLPIERSVPQTLEAKLEEVTLTSKPSTSDDFDFDSYYARLHDIPVLDTSMTPKLDTNTNVIEDSSFSEVDLNKSPAPDFPDNVDDENNPGIAADIAQNFSQLPQVLPQVASAVFSSFSSMLNFNRNPNYEDRRNFNDTYDATTSYNSIAAGVPEFEVAQQAVEEENSNVACEPVPLFDTANYVAGNVKSEGKRGSNASESGTLRLLDDSHIKSMESSECQDANVANVFRLGGGKKKTYAHVPGLTLGEAEPSLLTAPPRHVAQPMPKLPPLPTATQQVVDNTPHQIYQQSPPFSGVNLSGITTQSVKTNHPNVETQPSNFAQFYNPENVPNNQSVHFESVDFNMAQASAVSFDSQGNYPSSFQQNNIPNNNLVDCNVTTIKAVLSEQKTDCHDPAITKFDFNESNKTIGTDSNVQNPLLSATSFENTAPAVVEANIIEDKPPPMFFNPLSFGQDSTKQTLEVSNVPESTVKSLDSQDSSSLPSTQDVSKPPVVSQLPPTTTGNQFRLSSKRKQYYSGPIQGLNNITHSQKTFQPNISGTFAPNQVTSSEFAEYQSPQSNFTSDQATPQDFAHGTSYDNNAQYNSSFTYGTEEKPSLIAGIKKIPAAVNIGKIGSALTSFFDPNYYADKQKLQSAAPTSEPQYQSSSSNVSYDTSYGAGFYNQDHSFSGVSTSAQQNYNAPEYSISSPNDLYSTFPATSTFYSTGNPMHFQDSQQNFSTFVETLPPNPSVGASSPEHPQLFMNLQNQEIQHPTLVSQSNVCDPSSMLPLSNISPFVTPSSLPPCDLPQSPSPNIPLYSPLSYSATSALPSNVTPFLPVSNSPPSLLPSNLPPSNSPPSLLPSNLPPSNVPPYLPPSNSPPSLLPSNLPPSNLPPSNLPPFLPPSNLPQATSPSNVLPYLVPSNVQSSVPPSNLPTSLPPSNLPPALPSSNLPPTLPPANFPPSLPPSNLPPNLPPANAPPSVPPSNLPSSLPLSNLPPSLPPSNLPPSLPPYNLPPSLPTSGLPSSQLPPISHLPPRFFRLQTKQRVVSSTQPPVSYFTPDQSDTTNPPQTDISSGISQYAPMFFSPSLFSDIGSLQESFVNVSSSETTMFYHQNVTQMPQGTMPSSSEPENCPPPYGFIQTSSNTAYPQSQSTFNNPEAFSRFSPSNGFSNTGTSPQMFAVPNAPPILEQTETSMYQSSTDANNQNITQNNSEQNVPTFYNPSGIQEKEAEQSTPIENPSVDNSGILFNTENASNPSNVDAQYMSSNMPMFFNPNTLSTSSNSYFDNFSQQASENETNAGTTQSHSIQGVAPSSFFNLMSSNLYGDENSLFNKANDQNSSTVSEDRNIADAANVSLEKQINKPSDFFGFENTIDFNQSTNEGDSNIQQQGENVVEESNYHFGIGVPCVTNAEMVAKNPWMKLHEMPPPCNMKEELLVEKQDESANLDGIQSIQPVDDSGSNQKQGEHEEVSYYAVGPPLFFDPSTGQSVVAQYNDQNTVQLHPFPDDNAPERFVEPDFFNPQTSNPQNDLEEEINLSAIENDTVPDSIAEAIRVEFKSHELLSNSVDEAVQDSPRNDESDGKLDSLHFDEQDLSNYSNVSQMSSELDVTLSEKDVMYSKDASADETKSLIEEAEKIVDETEQFGDFGINSAIDDNVDRLAHSFQYLSVHSVSSQRENEGDQNCNDETIDLQNDLSIGDSRRISAFVPVRNEHSYAMKESSLEEATTIFGVDAIPDFASHKTAEDPVFETQFAPSAPSQEEIADNSIPPPNFQQFSVWKPAPTMLVSSGQTNNVLSVPTQAGFVSESNVDSFNAAAQQNLEKTNITSMASYFDTGNFAAENSSVPFMETNPNVQLFNVGEEIVKVSEDRINYEDQLSYDETKSNLGSVPEMSAPNDSIKTDDTSNTFQSIDNYFGGGPIQLSLDDADLEIKKTVPRDDTNVLPNHFDFFNSSVKVEANLSAAECKMSSNDNVVSESKPAVDEAVIPDVPLFNLFSSSAFDRNQTQNSHAFF